jgi:hypothetical protein
VPANRRWLANSAFECDDRLQPTVLIQGANEDQTMRLPRTTRHIMLTIAAVAAVLGLAVNYPWIVPCVLILALAMAPQSLVVALCVYLATRDKSGRQGITWLGEVRNRGTAQGTDWRRAPASRPRRPV